MSQRCWQRGVIGDVHRTPVVVGRERQEERGRTVSLVFVVDDVRRPGPHGTGKAGFLRRLPAGLIPADPNLVFGNLPRIRVPHLLPRRHERRVAARGKTPVRFQPRLDLLFQSPPYRFFRDALDDLPLHPTAGPQLPRPADTTLRRGRTGQSRQPRLLRSVPEFRSAVLRLPAAESGLQTLRNAALAQAFDRRCADAQGAREVHIPEFAAVAPFVRHPQNLRPPPGGSGTVDDRLELPTLRRRKAHSIELPALRVGQDPLRSPHRTPAGRLGSRKPDPSDPQESVGACTFGIGSMGMNQRAPYRSGAHACRHAPTRGRHGNLARILSSVQRFHTTSPRGSRCPG